MDRYTWSESMLVVVLRQEHFLGLTSRLLRLKQYLCSRIERL